MPQMPNGGCALPMHRPQTSKPRWVNFKVKQMTVLEYHNIIIIIRGTGGG